MQPPEPREEQVSAKSVTSDLAELRGQESRLDCALVHPGGALVDCCWPREFVTEGADP